MRKYCEVHDLTRSVRTYVVTNQKNGDESTWTPLHVHSTDKKFEMSTSQCKKYWYRCAISNKNERPLTLFLSRTISNGGGITLVLYRSITITGSVALSLWKLAERHRFNFDPAYHDLL